jgi:cell division protein ZapA
MDKNKVTVEIFGETYALKGDMDPERVKRLARIVDEQMKKVAKGNHRLPAARVAVLTAMNFCDDYLKLEADYQDLLGILKDE